MTNNNAWTGKPSQVAKRGVYICGRKTSVSVEQAFWDEFRAICGRRKVTVSETLAELDVKRIGDGGNNLSSAIRVFVLEEVKQARGVNRG